MAPEVGRLEMRTRRRSLAGYTAGLVLYTLAVVALYPAFRGDAALNRFVQSDSTAAALFGASGDITSSGGWLDANIYANFFPLIMLLLTIGYGAGAIAGQDEDGTLGLLVALPLPRRSLVLQKGAAMGAQAVLLAAAVGLATFAGRAFDLRVGVAPLVSASAAMVLMGLDFGLLAMTVGALTGRRSSAIGATTALAAVSYLVSSLAPVVSWLRPVRYASPLYWATGNDQIANGASSSDLGVLAGVAVAALCAAVAAFNRLDLH